MSEYIKKSDAREAIRVTCRNLNYITPPVMQLTSAIDKAPSADVVEVVRCRDCKYAELYINDDYLFCEYNECGFEKNDYCSYGVKNNE